MMLLFSSLIDVRMCYLSKPAEMCLTFSAFFSVLTNDCISEQEPREDSAWRLTLCLIIKH